ncbi:MAG: hypothetical protein KAJ48_04180 [Elusimicrobiales bacterium]|nr:hypothetical protein [Elusimicrobiales bacterium]
MGKIFIAFQYRGENLEEVEDWLNIIRDEVLKTKNDYFCSFWVEDMFQEKGYTDKQMYNYCLNKLDKCETVIFLLRSEKNSKGMIKELDHAVKKGKKIIVIIKQGLKFEEYRKKAEYLLEVKDICELRNKIKAIKV